MDERLNQVKVVHAMFFDDLTGSEMQKSVKARHSSIMESDPHTPDEIRRWISGREARGPIRLLTWRWRDPDEGLNFRIWQCEDLLGDRIVDVPDFDIGRKLLPEEVLAWMST